MKTFDKTYPLAFPVEAVYAHWISNDTVIAPAARMEIEPRVGGAYRLIMTGNVVMNGVFSRVLENQALTYSWQWHGSSEATEVNVRFTPSEKGTDVHIVHSGFESDDSYDNHASGWDSYINGFVLHLENSAG